MGRGGYLEIGGASRKYCNMAGLRDETLSTGWSGDSLWLLKKDG